MCRVYNTIGCLTTIDSHLTKHNINEYRSLNELIDFQNNYSVARQRIISDHKLLIEREKSDLENELAQLDHSIETKKSAVEQRLLTELETLKHRLANLLSVHSSNIRVLINFAKKIIFNLRIFYNKFTFNLKVTYSLKHLAKTYSEKNSRYQYIVSDFEGAVTKSCLPILNEIDRKKWVIDQINNSIYGALGELKVVKELEKLSDDHILINDFTCSFRPPLYNRQENDHIISIQVDHILICASGIFLIETKNWSQHSLNNQSLYSPVRQIKRTNFALYKILNGQINRSELALSKHHWGERKIPIRNLIVLINYKPVEEFQYVKILTLNDLLGYIKYFKPCFYANETQIIANHLLDVMR